MPFFLQVLSGNRLELHPKIPDSIQGLIELTMKTMEQRPTFTRLKEKLLEIRFGDGR
jgi:hypothetical protein